MKNVNSFSTYIVTVLKNKKEKLKIFVFSFVENFKNRKEKVIFFLSKKYKIHKIIKENNFLNYRITQHTDVCVVNLLNL